MPSGAPGIDRWVTDAEEEEVEVPVEAVSVRVMGLVVSSFSFFLEGPSY